MEYQNLTITLISATGLKKPRFTTKMDVYAVVFISRTSKDQKQRTSTVGGSNPTWNHPMKFAIDEADGLGNNQTLVVNIKAKGVFGGRSLGQVHVPVKELVEGVKGNVKAVETVSFQVRSPSGNPKGVLSFKYEFGEKLTGKAGTASGEQNLGYVYYRPPPWRVVQPRRCYSMGFGFGTSSMGFGFGTILVREALGGVNVNKRGA